MGFGNNPFVSKAQVAEQKARDAGDAGARERAWRDAARLWDRAAEREMEAKRRGQYEENALRARSQADGDEADGPDGEAPGSSPVAGSTAVAPAGKPN